MALNDDSSINSVLSASPNPIMLPVGGSVGVNNISSNAPGYPNAQVRVNSPNGGEFTCCGYGSAFTGDWVPNGTLAVDVQPGPNTITASPNPILVPFGTTLGTTTITYSAPAYSNAQVRPGSPTGPWMLCCGTSGSGITGNWVYNGANFYLVDGNTGTVLNTLTVNVQSAPAAISGNLFANGGAQLGATVSLTGGTAAGNTVSATAQADSGGNYSFLVPAGGAYTAVTFLSGYSFSPASTVYNGISASQSTGAASSSQTAATSQNCSDISGTWTDGLDSYSFSETLGLVSVTNTYYPLPYGNIVWSASGQTTDGLTFSMRVFNPVATGTAAVPDQEDDFTLTNVTCTSVTATLTNRIYGTGACGSSFVAAGPPASTIRRQR